MAAYRVGGEVSAPKVIYEPDPEYTKEARKAKIQGTCVLWLIVGADGLTHDIRVAHSLDHGLDEKAIQAVQRWKFEPAMKDGKPLGRDHSHRRYVADIAWKSNRRNFNLLIRERERPRQHKWRDWVFIWF
jgi:TonB family protein